MQVPIEIARLSRLKTEELVKELCEIDLAAFGSGRNWSKESFFAERTRKWELSHVAMIGPSPIGFAVVSARSQRIAHLHRLAVNPEYRGRRVGSDLLCAVEQVAHGFGNYLIQLEVDSGVSSHRFYTNLGYGRLQGDLLDEYLVRMGKHSERALYTAPKKVARQVFAKGLDANDWESLRERAMQ